MSRLTDIIPMPRPVTLAGRGFDVWPARLIDLAELQSWIDRKYDDPLPPAWEAIYGDEPLRGEDRDNILRSALKAPESPAWDEPEGYQLAGTLEGVAYTLYLGLRRGQPDIAVSDCVTLATTITMGEYAAFRRAWLGVNSKAEIQALLLGDLIPNETNGDRVSWNRIIDDVARERHWTYDYIHTLTPAQIVNARHNGEPPDPLDVPIRGDVMAFAAEWDRRINGEPSEVPQS